MGDNITVRGRFILEVNRAFAPDEIAQTLRKLHPIPEQDDALDIFHKLGLFTWLRGAGLTQYRRELKIPHLNQHIAALAVRASLLHQPHPKPLKFNIVEGAVEAVHVAVSDDAIELTLTRTDFDPLLAKP